MINKLFKFVDKNSNKIILINSLILSITSFIYFYNQDLITAYGDSRAHLNIARRVVDNLTPGFGQLGGAWLPLLHVLMLPMIGVDYLWKSGIAGSLVNMVFFILGSIFIYKLVLSITKQKLNAFIAFLIFSLNVNILYFQAAPMGEVLFISCFIVALYFLYEWASFEKIPYLLISAVFFTLASLTRYEGWFVVVGAIISVLIYSYFSKGRKKAEGSVILFGYLAGLGIFLWLLWQWAIFGDPFDFLHSEFAAAVNTARDIAAGTVPTYKNLTISLLTEVYATFHTSGVILTILGLISFLYFLIRYRLNLFKKPQMILIITLIPLLFEVLVLYKGIVPTHVPEIMINNKIPNFFNVRYTLFNLPALVIFTSILTRKKFILALLMLLILINNFMLLPIYSGQITALNHPGLVENSQEYTEILNWFHQYYDKGLVLVSAASSDALIFQTNLEMKKFISEGSGKYWKESMSDPSKYARWVLIQDSGRDSLLKHLDMDALSKDFDLQKKSARYKFYKIKNN